MSEETGARNMRTFFHADVSGYNAALRHALIIVIIPLLAVCTFCAVNIVLHFNSDFARLLVFVIIGCVLFGMIFSFCAAYLAYKYKRRHSRFTFFDILPNGMIFSEYAGEFVHWGEQYILRKLYYIPFESFEEVTRDAKTAPRELKLKGEIREYFYETEWLGYHVDEDGNLTFDTAVLNFGMYETLSELRIKKRFGNTKPLMNAILFYKEKFDSIPEKKPFDISQYVSTPRRKKHNTSNPALEAPSFSRKWK